MLPSKKGFTLIELLVVVAIIGILAAVGTVAYTGYTSGAQKNAAKSNYANAVKYINNELQKCALDRNAEGTFIDSLKKISGSKTIIIVSHKENILNSCDKVIKINHKMIEIIKQA